MAGKDESKKEGVVVQLVGANRSLKAAPPIVATDTAAIQSNAFEIEDEFKKVYVGQGQGSALTPTYNLKTLDKLCMENNALSPCIEAMVTNIDGTGYTFELKDGTTEDNEDATKIGELEDFFGQVWPGESFTTVRMKLRRDIERTGNGYMEVSRTASGEIAFIRHVDSKTIRLCELSEAIPVKHTLTRKGKEVSLTLMTRQRRYMQFVGIDKFVYFKDFGIERDLDKSNGKWAQNNQKLPAAKRATELLHFKALPDAVTPYGVPRWISQLPSVLGSRKAEEFNLEFFDNGGVPPVLLLVEGGTLAHVTRDALEKKTTGLASKVNRVQVIETEPQGGSIDKPGTVRVRVERFGSERQADSMFENYDEKCEIRVRRAFRLPPIFIGAAQDYNFATAYASYAVTEAQVFAPERQEFDTIMSTKVLPAMGYPEYKLLSNPLTIEDVANKLKGIELAIGTNRVEPEDVVFEINEATGLDLGISKEPIVDPNKLLQVTAQREMQTEKLSAANANSVPAGVTPAVSKADFDPMLALAVDMTLALRSKDATSLVKNLTLVNQLSKEEQARFDHALASMKFLQLENDPDGLAELSHCTLAIMAGQEHAH